MESLEKFESTYSFKCFDDVIQEVDDIVKNNPKYENRSHYIRAAIIKLNREETKKE